MTELMIEADGLVKRFGKVEALAGLTLTAPAGGVLAVLGPNGAGKSTFVRTVATLTQPDAGTLSVAGIDALRHPRRVRSNIGLAGQSAAVEEAMTGSENLEMIARLFGFSKAEARRRSDAVLERLDLTEAASRLVRGWSGGMRRRLDLGRHAGRRAEADAARRTDDRARPGEPDRAVGGRPGAGRRRHRRAADDAIPGGGRPPG